MKKRVLVCLLVLPLLLLLTACLNFGSGGVQHKLMVEVLGQGTVDPGHKLYRAGSMVTFNIQAAPGWQFSRWEGQNSYDVNLNGSNWTILMNSDKCLRAVFVQGGNSDPEDGFRLTVTVEGLGFVSPDSGVFAPGTEVRFTITERRDLGHSFKRWLGADAGDVVFNGELDYSIIMDSDKELIAYFWCASL